MDFAMYIVFCFVHWKVENISKVNWWEHIIGCMQLRQREPYFIASYHNISNDLKRLNLYYEVHSLYGDVLCQFMLTVHSYCQFGSCCDSQLAIHNLRFTACEIAQEIVLLWKSSKLYFYREKKTKEKEDTVRILNNSFYLFLLNEWMSSCSFFLNVSV